MNAAPNQMEGGLDRLLTAIFRGWRFPIITLSLLFFVTLLMGSVLIIPPGQSALAAFAEDFKIWCFGYDPETGKLEIFYVVMLLVDPLVIGVVVLAVWWVPLRMLFRQGFRVAVPWIALSGVVVTTAAGGMTWLWSGGGRPDGEMTFPAERLRTAHQAPDLRLTDQDGSSVDLTDFRGQVVVLTGVYATCGHTCPLILQQVKRAVDALSPELQARVTVLAITLDPVNDTPEAMRHMATNHGMTTPRYRLLTGSPADVEPLLDKLSIARTKDPETGVIDHANLYSLVDAHGRIAYRLTIGDRQERWLVTALEHLAREAAAIRPSAG